MSKNDKNLNSILQDIVRSIEVISSRMDVDINLHTGNAIQIILNLSNEIYPNLTQLFTEIIANISEGSTIDIYTRLIKDDNARIELQFHIGGVSLDIYIDDNLKHKYGILISNQNDAKIISLQFPLSSGLQLLDEYEPKKNHDIIKPLYAEVRNRLTTHFKSVKNLEQHAENSGVEQGKFIKEVNHVLADHISDSKFDISKLANCMIMSIPQLYRKMKAVSNMSPARYIRFVRLQKAKEYLEKGELTISEVLLEVGIVSNSHFTKIFNKEFGFNPSAIKNNKMNETD